MDASSTGAVFLGMGVDGFIARPDGDLAWLTGGEEAGGAPDDGEGGDFGFAGFLAGIDALVMGRGTYEVVAPLAEWPYQGKPVHVLSTTLEPDPAPPCTALIGEGHTPFGPLPGDVLLELVRTRTFPGGMVQSTYRVR
ncbi:dihydrofolate reductase family protein [Geodermatophilus sp. SYSU D00779]